MRYNVTGGKHVMRAEHLDLMQDGVILPKPVHQVPEKIERKIACAKIVSLG